MRSTRTRSTTRRRLVAATAVVLTSASVATATASTMAAATATTVPAGESDATIPAGDPDATIVAGFVLEPTNLDLIHTAGAALDQVLLDNIYETLLEATPEGEISPGLATLEISEDRLTYTLTLQDGITFQDGDPLTASDVVWTLDQQRGEGANEAARLASIESVEATDDLTVVLTLSQPDNDLAFYLSRRAGAVLNEGATDLETTANGTGPFTLGEWSQGSFISLLRNDDYWGEPAKAAEVVFQYFTDPNAAVNAVLDGDADFITGVDPDLVGQFDGNADFTVLSNTTNGELTLGFNNADEVLSDQRVRQAITQAIDKQGVIDLNNGYGTIIGAPVPAFDPWYEDLTGLYPYDTDAARALLEEAGYGDGLELSFVVPNFYPPRIPDFVVSSLADVGITLDLQAVEFSTWLQQVYTNHDYDLTYVLHVEPRDIDNYANPDYYWLYDSPEVQRLLAEAKTTPDQEQAIELRRQAARQIAEDAPAVWLTLADDIVVADVGVTGIPEFDRQNRFDASDLQVDA
jgi:peptide/nickel transport system substrate-binding protein